MQHIGCFDLYRNKYTNFPEPWEFSMKIRSFVKMITDILMAANKKINKLFIALIAGTLLGCASGGIPISTNTKYPIEVLYENQPLERPYSEIGLVEISNEDSLTARQTKDKRMMYRGNDAKTKELLTARLVMKAQKIGADAIINVRYKYYTSVKSEGYMLSGLAVRYRGE
jgi:hypothetical protein